MDSDALMAKLKGLQQPAEREIAAVLALDAKSDFVKKYFLDLTDNNAKIMIEQLVGRPGAGAGLGPESEADVDVRNTIIQRAKNSYRFLVSVLGDTTAVSGGKVQRTHRSGVIISPTCAATYAHGSHSNWECGQEKELEVHSQDADRMRIIKASVVIIKGLTDFTILEFSDGVKLDAPIVDTAAPVGEPFYVHGMSCPGSDKTSISHGIIAGTVPDKHSHIFGDIPTGKGDSGGGVFSVNSGKLVGMMVGRDRDLQKSRFVPALLLHEAALSRQKLEDFKGLPDQDEGMLSDQEA